METLTDREMLEIEGGDWWDVLVTGAELLVSAAACL